MLNRFWYIRRAREERAFTLIELLVVILIIGILLTIAAPSFLGQQNKAYDSKAKQYLAIAYKQAKAVAADNEGSFGSQNTIYKAIVSGEPELQVGTASTNAAGSIGTTEQVYVINADSSGNLLLAIRSKSGSIFSLSVSGNDKPQITSASGKVVQTVIPACGAYCQEVKSTSGLLFYYRFDDPLVNGGAAADASGNNRPGVFAISGNCASVIDGTTPDDTSKGVNLPNGCPTSPMVASPAINGNAIRSWSSEVWVKIGDPTVNGGRFINYGSATNVSAWGMYGQRWGGCFDYGLHVMWWGDGTYYGGYPGDDSHTQCGDPLLGTSGTYGNYEQLVYVRDGVSQKTTLYLNGVPIAQKAAGSANAGTLTFNYGASGSYSDPEYLDEASGYGIALTPAQVARHYAIGIGKPPTAPSASSPATISGSTVVGYTLQATDAAWNTWVVSQSYQWQRCDSAGNNCSPISGATGYNYTTTNSDVGYTIEVVSTATNPMGTGTSTSAPTAVISNGTSGS